MSQVAFKPMTLMERDDKIYSFSKSVRPLFQKPVNHYVPSANKYSTVEMTKYKKKAPIFAGPKAQRFNYEQQNKLKNPTGPQDYHKYEDWSKSGKIVMKTSERPFNPTKTPGPGKYNTQNTNFYLTKQPQYSLKGRLQPLKKFVNPGPGKYDPVYSIISGTELTNASKFLSFPQSNTKTRDGAAFDSYYVPSKTPAVGQYKWKDISKKSSSANFGTSSRIFGEGATFVKPEVNPLGPGQYDPLYRRVNMRNSATLSNNGSLIMQRSDSINSAHSVEQFKLLKKEKLDYLIESNRKRSQSSVINKKINYVNINVQQQNTQDKPQSSRATKEIIQSRQFKAYNFNQSDERKLYKVQGIKI